MREAWQDPDRQAGTLAGEKKAAPTASQPAEGAGESPLAGAFTARYGRAPDVLAAAPGRVNLLGEHTDYNGGYVLPIAIPQQTRVALAWRTDDQVVVWSEAKHDLASYHLGTEHHSGSWIDYVQGVTAALARQGYALRGFEALIRSDVPIGGGLSSSAALEVALLRGLRDGLALRLDGLTLARLAQWGENEVVGAPVGILDPMACHLADEHTALFLDTRSLQFERLALPTNVELVVINSEVRHANVGGGYRTRRAECETAARLLGVQELRDVDPGAPEIAHLPPPLDRRVRHVVSENARVLQAVEALRAGDAPRLGQLFYASHRSMRDDFEVSVPAVDALVQHAQQEPGVFGARLTGGGFGGSIVCLVAEGTALDIGRRLATGGAHLLVPQQSGSCRRLW